MIEQNNAVIGSKSKAKVKARVYRHRCPYCQEKFTQFFALVAHVRYGELKGGHCPACGKTLSPRGINNHIAAQARLGDDRHKELLAFTSRAARGGGRAEFLWKGELVTASRLLPYVIAKTRVEDSE